MIKPVKPFHIVTHQDLDGGVSAICIIDHIKQKYGKDAEYKVWFGTYKNVDAYVERLMDWPEQYERVFIADIHTHPDLARQFPKNFLLMDHHASAEELNKIDQCIIDTNPNVCGAALCYKHLLMEEGLKYKHLTKLVAIANDYDCWIHKLPDNVAKNLNFMFYYYWGEEFIKRFKGGFNGFNAVEKGFLNKKWKEIHSQIQNTPYIDVLADTPYKNKICLIKFTDNNGELNEICDHVLTKLNYHVAISVIAPKHKISTRVTAHAEKCGLHVGNFHSQIDIGGGHARAGGAQYHDEDHLNKILDLFKNKVIELKI